MGHIAKVFMTGRSQAVRLPAEFRFETDEVFIHRDPATGNVILSARPRDWEELFELQQAEQIEPDFLADRHDLPAQKRAIF